VSFTAPADNGGASITSYAISSNTGGFSGTVAGSGSGSITLTGLDNETTYTFTVTATNIAGTSAPSAASNPVTPANVPDAPTNITATLSNVGAVLVAFDAPASNGGASIMSYSVISNPAGGTGTVAGPGSGSLILTGLNPATAYTFSVTATNAAGISAPSATSNTITPDIEIGNYFQGGVVFYLAPSNTDLNGDGIADNGLVCAVEDQVRKRWYNGAHITTGATGTAIGTGWANTQLIINVQGATETDYAAGIARAYQGGGYTDWFLPSKYELDEMYQNMATINATAADFDGSNLNIVYYYNSSSEFDFEKAWMHHFNNGYWAKGFKQYSNCVRAIRAF
jgi:hypothetical protein